MERLWRPEGVNISKGRVRAECMEESHMAAENTGEHQRMLRMKFYVTIGCSREQESLSKLNSLASLIGIQII